MIRFKRRDNHDRDVEALQSLLTKREGVYALAKGPSHTMREGAYKQGAKPLDLHKFTGILALDTTALTVVVEPKVTVESLTRFCLRYGLMPPVVPEFPGITVGGAILGAALESSSHRYGQFNDAALSYEVLLGDGTRLEVSRENHSDLFYALPGSYGSLALLTAVKLQLILALPWVDLDIRSFETKEELIAALIAPNEADFLEGIYFGDKGAEIVGMMREKPSYKVSKGNRWYYHQVLENTAIGGATVSMPLLDYLFRLDAGAFWMGRYLLRPTHFLRALFGIALSTLPRAIKESARSLPLEREFPPVVRSCFGFALSSCFLYRLWHKVPFPVKKNLFFIQDFYTPEENALDALHFFSEKTAMAPIWLCPIKGTLTPQLLSPHLGAKKFLNIGLYGVPLTKTPIPQLTRECEEQLAVFGGRKMLYAITYYSKESFQKIYPSESYEAIRAKYKAEGAFLPLYKKIVDVV